MEELQVHPVVVEVEVEDRLIRLAVEVEAEVEDRPRSVWRMMVEVVAQLQLVVLGSGGVVVVRGKALSCVVKGEVAVVGQTEACASWGPSEEVEAEERVSDDSNSRLAVLFRHEEVAEGQLLDWVVLVAEGRNVEKEAVLEILAGLLRQSEFSAV